MDRYNIDDLRKDGSLKAGFSLVFTSFFLARQIFYGPVSILVSRKTRGSSGAEIDLSWLAVHNYMEFVACIPALLVLFILAKRSADSAAWVKYAWSKGVWILLTSAVLQIFAQRLVFIDGTLSLETSGFVIVLIHVYLVLYLLKSRRVKDVFSMFPAYDADKD